MWTEWLLEGSHSDRTWLDRSHLASNYSKHAKVTFVVTMSEVDYFALEDLPTLPQRSLTSDSQEISDICF